MNRRNSNTLNQAYIISTILMEEISGEGVYWYLAEGSKFIFKKQEICLNNY